MSPESVDGVQLDGCPNCGGVWFDGDELKTILQASKSGIQDIERASPHVTQEYAGTSRMLCPIDEVLLESYHYMYSSPVVLHGCSKCGGFFACAADLPKMEQALNKEIHPDSLEQRKAIALAEFEGAHAQFMARQALLQSVYGTFSRFTPGWYM
jgi:Zn-finger nucleic acid-binding protein